MKTNFAVFNVAYRTQHAASPDYNVQKFRDNPNFISDVVKFDIPRLPDLKGKNVVHLQCHIGTDTLSLARLGAASVTGLDFSAPALEEARRIASTSAGGEKLVFVQSDLYNAPNVLDHHSFDVVFTGIGALCWLHSIKDWAQVVCALLKPGGRLFIREGHPVIWAMADHSDKLQMELPYFERPESSKFDEQGTYMAADGYVFQNTKTEEFNHGIGEIITAVLEAGMRLEAFVEHDSVPWCALDGQFEEIGNGEWRLKDRPWRCPVSYTLVAVKM